MGLSRINSIFLHDNDITDVEETACIAYDSAFHNVNDGQSVTECAALLCPPLTYFPAVGRQEEEDVTCLECVSNEVLWGASFCLDGDGDSGGNGDISDGNDNHVPIRVSEREIWDNNDGWFEAATAAETGSAQANNNDEDENDICSWFGIRCDRRSPTTSRHLTNTDVHYLSRESHPQPLRYSSSSNQNQSTRSNKRENYSVTSIRLPKNNLRGSPSPTLFHLSNLQVLDLSDNAVAFHFSDLDPNHNNNNNTSFQTPPPLESINLRSTQTFSVTGVSSVASTLRELHLESNAFTSDAIPSELFLLTKLKHLALDNGGFVGKLSQDVGKLTDLSVLSASSNDLTGPLPSSLSTLSRLSVLRLRSNRLSGEIAVPLGADSDSKREWRQLSVLDLSRQKRGEDGTGADIDGGGFTGPLPTFRNFPLMRRLNLERNGFSGPIPENFLVPYDEYAIDGEGGAGSSSTMTSRRTFEYADLSYNNLTGGLPSSLLLLLPDVYLQENQITGVIEVCGDDDALLDGTPLDKFGCDGILCPPHTFNSVGRKENYEEPCRKCADGDGGGSSTAFYGRTTCASPLGEDGDVADDDVDGDGNDDDYYYYDYYTLGIDDDTEVVDGNNGGSDGDGSSDGNLSMSDREVLVLLYMSCGGRYWHDSTNWITANSHICTWTGVTCDDSKKVTKLSLRSNNLVGSIPGEVFAMKTLEALEFDGNDIVATFENIGLATSLKLLDLSHTGVSSVQGIDAAKTLEQLYLTSTRLAGHFPSGLLELKKLSHLSLDFNSMVGTVPDLSPLNNLEFLSLHNNEFHGPIPHLPTGLKILHLQENAFRGTVAEWFDELQQLLFVDLSNQKTAEGTGLNGTLPTFSDHPFLKRLDLSGNSFSSYVPPGIIANVDENSFQYLDLSKNLLTGMIPRTLARFDTSMYDLSDNLISEVPNELCDQVFDGAVTTYNCDAVLCPPMTYNEKGRDLFRMNTCLECPTLPAGIYGSSTCQDGSETDDTSSSSSSSLPSSDADEREILATFYNACGGKRWTRQENWMTDVSICQWFGIECTNDGNSVKFIALSVNNIIGTPPSSIFDLPNLQALVLDSNNILFDFEGIERATRLQYLDLSNTKLFHTEGIGNAKKLKELRLSSNDLTGNIPDELFSLTALEELYLDFNEFSGVLPDAIRYLSKLQFLSLQSNKLTGSLPASLFQLDELASLRLNKNSFSGKLPTEMEQMTNLMYVNLSHQTNPENPDSGLSGELLSLKSLSSLRRIDLSYNAFTGTIPNDFLAGVNPNLFGVLDLQSNMLSGSIPKEISRLGVESIFLQDNFISSVQDYCDVVDSPTITKYGCKAILCPPSSFSPSGKAVASFDCHHCLSAQYWGATECEADSETASSFGVLLTEREVLTKLYQSCQGDYWDNANNWLEDGKHVCSWEGINCVNNRVQSINLGANNLSGEPPPEIFHLQELEFLSLYSNSLGKFSFEQISFAKSLRVLLLDATGITAVTGISRAPKLERISLRFNKISDEFPTEILYLNSLKSLSMSHNKLTSLPNFCCELENLSTLILASNNIGGNLFDISFPPSLRTLDLSDNLLSNYIPSSFLDNLPVSAELHVDLSGNSLVGTVPSEMSRFEMMTLSLENNLITGIDEEICEQTEWNDGDIGRYGCNGLLCSVGHYAKKGRHSSSGKCLKCKSSKVFGATSCEESSISSAPVTQSRWMIAGIIFVFTLLFCP